MALDVLFAIRGLLAFISFTEFTTSGRCFLPVILPEENGTYVQTKIFSQVDLSCRDGQQQQQQQHQQTFQASSGEQEFSEAERIVSHTFGLYCLLNGLVVLHLAIYIHYSPLVTLSFSTVFCKLLFLLLHSFAFRTINAGQNLIFPLISCAVTLVAVIAVPFCTSETSFLCGWRQDENAELLRKMKLPKKSKQH